MWQPPHVEGRLRRLTGLVAIVEFSMPRGPNYFAP
jgi:hypothetical protein